MPQLTCRSSRLAGFGLLAGVLLLMSACGGDDGNKSTATTSSGGAATATSKSGDNGGGSGGSATSKPAANGTSSDLDKLEQDLVPPKSKQVARFSADDGVVVTYTSTESLSTLKDYYDKKIKDLKLKVQGTLNVTDSYSWFIGDDNNKSAHGAVIIAKSGNDPVSVSVTLAPGE